MKKRISKPECMLPGTSQTEMKYKEKKEGKKELWYCVTIKDKQANNGIPETEGKKKKEEEIVEALMAENFPKLMTNTNHRSRKLRGYQVAYSKNLHLLLCILYSNCIKTRRKCWRNTEGKKHTLCIKKQAKNYVKLSFKNHVSNRRVE